VPDERRVVFCPIDFTADNGEKDRWQRGQQFWVTGWHPSKTPVQRGVRKGWIHTADLNSCSKAIPTHGRLHPGNRREQVEDPEVTRQPCDHGSAQIVRSSDGNWRHSLLWCPNCGSIARSDGSLVELVRPTEPPPGSSAFLSPQ
jgi:hypothetical protein